MRLYIFALVGCLVALSSLRVIAQTGALPTGVSIEELLGTVLRMAAWRTRDLKVCWENPTDENLAGRKIVASAVKDTWLHGSALTVSGWEDKCSETEGNFIRILIKDDELPRAEALGRYLGDRPNGVILNFALDAYWPSRCVGQQQLDHCIYVVAVHEFGHVLGFTHEQNRDDAEPVCHRDFHAGTIGDYKVTEYDPESVMNACSKAWNGDGKLSKLDKAALAEVYGDE